MSFTLDTPAAGITIAQPKKAFRYGSEAFWLVGYALEGGVPATAADLGTGSGIVPALLAGLGVDAVGFDAHPEWLPLWAETLRRTRVSGKLRLEQNDVASALPGKYALVTANPPFFPAGTGPGSPDPWKRAARTESTASLDQFVQAALAILAPGGRVVIVIPRARESEVRGPVSRTLRVGARRSLIELVPGSTPTPIETIGEGDGRVAGWYGRCGASFGLGGPV